MHIVARLKYLNEIAQLSALGVDKIMCDTHELTTKALFPMDMDQIKAVSIKIKAHGMRAYVLINKMIHEYDLEHLHAWLRFLKEIDIDGIVINDYTCYVVAKTYQLHDKIIYQPGTMNTNHFDVTYLETRIKGMTLSKEITLDEIKAIIDQTTSIEFSLVGHGFIDMFYSKRKLISLYLEHKQLEGYRVKNNHHFTIEEKTRVGIHYPILEDEKGTHIFRDKKLQSFDEIKQIKDRITDFFIERLFMDDEEYYDSIKAYQNDSLEKEFLAAYGHEYHHGFYNQPTQKVKGELYEN